jgi:hypothetical protein
MLPHATLKGSFGVLRLTLYVHENKHLNVGIVKLNEVVVTQYSGLDRATAY